MYGWKMEIEEEEESESLINNIHYLFIIDSFLLVTLRRSQSHALCVLIIWINLVHWWSLVRSPFQQQVPSNSWIFDGTRKKNRGKE